MDSTLRGPAARAFAAALLFAACGRAAALNHDLVMSPVAAGPFAVACSNVELDMAVLNSIGGQPSDYWEGAEVAGSNRYVTQVLAHPETALAFKAPVPFKPAIYPLFFGRNVDFLAIVCHPTPRDNPDPDYAIPVQGGVVPHMQRAGAAPRLISAGEFAQTLGMPGPASPQAPAALPLISFSHGLGGSPLGPGYIDVLKALAAQGYMVAAVFHADNRFSKVRIEDLSDLAYALAFFPVVVEMQLMRPVALKSMVDVVLANPGYAPGIDTTRIGGFGASLGGEAMIHLLGGQITASLSKSCEDPVYDPRIRAAVGYVPYAGQSFLPAFCQGQSGARNVNRPFLAISGTADTTAPLTQAKQAVNNFSSSRFMVEIAGGKHELATENIPDVLTWTVTFLNAYLDVPWDNGMARFIRTYSIAGGGSDILTVDAHVPMAAGGGEARTLEFYDAARDNYVLAAGEADIAAKAAQSDLVAMDQGFKVFAGVPDGAVRVCRYAGADGQVNFGIGDPECGLLARSRGARAIDPAYGLTPVGADGRCGSGLLEVNRAWAAPAGRFTPGILRSRLTTSDLEIRGMAATGWTVRGPLACARP